MFQVLVVSGGGTISKSWVGLTKNEYKSNNTFRQGVKKQIFYSQTDLRMIICKRPAPQDDHLLEAGPLWMTFFKRPVPTDDHLQEAGQFR